MKKTPVKQIITLYTFRIYFKAMFTFAPQKALQKAFKLFFTPRSKKLRQRELHILKEAEKSIFSFSGISIQTYQWGKGSKTALLVHGWEGNAGNLGAFVNPLLEKGYRVIAFDGPAHGKSEGRQTNIFQFSSLLQELIETYTPELLLTHSFGSATGILTLHRRQQHPVNKMVMLTTPDQVSEIISNFARLLNFSKENERLFFRYIEEQFGQSIRNLKVRDMVSSSGLDQLMIIHSKSDRVLSFAGAERVAASAPYALFEAPQNLGHYKLLWDKEIIEKVSTFIEQEVPYESHI